MLRLILGSFLLASCSLGTTKDGGDRAYVYDAQSDYSSEELYSIAPQVVRVSKRNPPVGEFNQVFDPKLRDLKRIGIIVFETIIQPTRGGIAENNKVYLSETGKQFLTEKLLSIWEQSFPIIDSETEYVPTAQIKKSKSMHNYGAAVEDYVKTRHSKFSPDDIFYLPKGKKTTEYTVLNPRGMRDISFLLVPAGELMMGPKWSEHQKLFVNEVAREMKLDAVIVALSEISWSAAHLDKHSGEFIPEEMRLKINSSILIPMSQYEERLKANNLNNDRLVNVCYGSYDSEMKFPVKISVPSEEENFATIEKEILLPMQKAYKDLAQMTIIRMVQDLKKTY